MTFFLNYFTLAVFLTMIILLDVLTVFLKEKPSGLSSCYNRTNFDQINHKLASFWTVLNWMSISFHWDKLNVVQTQLLIKHINSLEDTHQSYQLWAVKVHLGLSRNCKQPIIGQSISIGWQLLTTTWETYECDRNYQRMLKTTCH